MTMSHRFQSLVETPALQTVLIVGTGLSTPTAPTVEGLKSKLDKVAQGLGVAPNEAFYVLAESVLDNLKATGKSDDESRLCLAEELGLLDERRWFGEVGLPVSGNTPRHRAIARFAVEKRLRSIVSLNWDTLLEAALDSVGLATGVRTQRPWDITSHASVVDDTQIKNLHAHVFPVFKPHGCVRNLEQARKVFRATGATPPIVFKLTHSELNNLPAQQKTLVDTQVHGHIAQCPLIAVGWRATEGYLREIVIRTAKAVMRTECDSFTLASRSWYPKKAGDDTFHDDIAAAYSKTKLESFVPVGNPGQPTLDCLLQWLQARYALNKLIVVAPAPQRMDLQQQLQQIDLPGCDHPVLGWVDSWLPTWVRLCWRAGVMRGTDPHTNQTVPPYDIPVMPRDVHVPLGCMTGERRELEAAAKLLVGLGNCLGRFDYEKFPGGLWDAETRDLYIPLPGWRGATQPADLAALQPLVEALRGLGYVRNIRLVWLDTEDTVPDETHRNQLAAQVSRLMPLQKFARSEALTWIGLDELKEAHHEPVA